MDRKNELCDKALEYFLEHGLADLSLRPLAEQIGSSARLLIYHFGSKEGLITTVMAEVHRRNQHSFSELMHKTQGQGGLETFWGWVVDAKNSRYVRLLFEVQMLALKNPDTYAQYIEGSSSSWLDLIEDSLPPSPDSRAIATLCAAVIDGLVLEYLNTGDLVRTSKALSLFCTMLQNQ
jgi:AcrR family transcriptional regulator